MNSIPKILPYLPEVIKVWRMQHVASRVVVTNGCFDLLHAGHVSYLEQAKSFGDHLVVGVNSDASVKALKGEGRPINSEFDRARVVAALECVDAVIIFPDVRATNFLQLIHPVVYVKGGDYKLESLDAGERSMLESMGSHIAFVDLVPNKSTTLLISKL